MVKSIIFPQTFLTRDISETLAFCFNEVYLLRLADLFGDVDDSPGRLPEMFRFLEATQTGGDLGPAPVNLQNLMNQWQAWVADHRGSGEVEIMKAGVKPPPPDRETSRALMNQIRSGRIDDDRMEKQPSAPPALVLNLAHLLDKQESEISRSLAAADESQEKQMSELLGVDRDETIPAGSRVTDQHPLYPANRVMEPEAMIVHRLKAWAELAPRDGLDGLIPSTLSPQVAGLLMDRANLIRDGASPDGRMDFRQTPMPRPNKDAGPAREVLKLRLPGPGEGDRFRDTLTMMFKALGNGPLSSGLVKSIQEIGRDWAKLDNPEAASGCLSLVVFPGYSWSGLLDLMQNQPSRPDQGGIAYPLLVIQ